MWAFLQINVQMKIWLRRARYNLKDEVLQELRRQLEVKKVRPWYAVWRRWTCAHTHYRRALLKKGLAAFENELNASDIAVAKLRKGAAGQGRGA